MSRLSIIILLSLQALAMAADDVTHTGDAEAPAITTPPSAQELEKRQCRTVTHSVQAGESLDGIAQTMHAGECNMCRRNNIPDRNKIWAGQHLLVALNCDEEETDLDAAGRCCIPAAAAHVHTAKKGDTFWELAVSNGVPVASVIAANPKVDRDAISVGVALTIPARPTNC